MSKLTQWHNGYVKPVHEGVYQIDTTWGPCYSNFVNGYWMLPSYAGLTKSAMKIASTRTDDESKIQNRKWRGLAEKP